MDNKTILVTLMVVLIVFVVLLAALGIVFVVALRKRTPIVKVIMTGKQDEQENATEQSAPAADADTAEPEAVEGAEEVAPVEQPEPEPEPEDDDDEAPTYVTEGQERVSYNRSLTAKICQLPDVSKDWYSQLKNELLSYENVKTRMSWRHEAFRVGRMVIARLVVRGKTLCLLLAVEPSGYNGTKYSVDDVSNIARLADTPTMYRIKSLRRFKYAKEMITGIMKELKVFKNTQYIASDYFLPYEGDMSLMQRGLVKRVVSGTTRTFRIEEVGKSELKDAAATTDAHDDKKN